MPYKIEFFLAWQHLKFYVFIRHFPKCNTEKTKVQFNLRGKIV